MNNVTNPETLDLDLDANANASVDTHVQNPHNPHSAHSAHSAHNDTGNADNTEDEDGIFVLGSTANDVPNYVENDAGDRLAGTPVARAPACVPPGCSPTVLKLPSCPGILRLRTGMSKHFTRVYPTRRVALTPPAMAGVVSLADIELTAAVAGHPDAKALVVFLPPDFEPLIPALAGQCPGARVHPDIDQLSQAAYLCWETASGTPPSTLWVQPALVLEALELNDATTGQQALPVVFVAGQTVATGGFIPSQEWLAQVRSALAEEERAPIPLPAQAMDRAADKALKYGQRPWLFMRYELANAGRRLAVNWAPMCRPRRQD